MNFLNDGRILHAHLVFGHGGILLSSVKDHGYPDLCQSPGQIGGNTVEIIGFVQDIEDRYGANVIIPLEGKPYGGKEYTAKNPEGYTWVFGSYDPWKTDDEANK